MKKYLLVIENEKFAANTESILFKGRYMFKKIGSTKYYVWMNDNDKEELMDTYDFMAIIEMETKVKA